LNLEEDPESCNDSEVAGFGHPSKSARVRGMHSLEEVERTKMSEDVRG
jgi:hypothetical protein